MFLPRVAVEAEELGAEVEEEGGAVDEVATEHAARLHEKSIEPFHTQLPHPLGGTLDLTGLKVYRRTKRHPYLYAGHAVTMGGNPFLLLGGAETDKHGSSTRGVDNIDDVLTLFVGLFKSERGRICAYDHLSSDTGIDVARGLLADAGHGAKQKYMAVRIGSIVHVIIREKAAAGDGLGQRMTQQFGAEPQDAAVTDYPLGLAIASIERFVALELDHMVDIGRNEHSPRFQPLEELVTGDITYRYVENRCVGHR